MLLHSRSSISLKLFNKICLRNHFQTNSAMGITKYKHNMLKEITYISRLSVVKLLMTLILFSLLSATASFAQITLSESKSPITKVLKKIRTQSGYDLLFDYKDLEAMSPVNIFVRDASIEQVLQRLFAGQPFSYLIGEDQTITIVRNKGSVSQRLDITGIVSDENGNALHGALVKIKSTKQFAITPESGIFMIKDVPLQSVLSVSFIGYETQEKIITRKQVNIKMVVSATNLEEINIISNGYQFTPKERATGSFNLVDSSLFNRKTSTNILDRLDGVTSGVLFNTNKQGNTPNLSIRDRSTISANANPLIILDNFPYDGDINNVNPQDVKSITILKDASAAAIWGSRAGNGVIVIVTKTGALNQRPMISINANITVGSKPDPFFREQISNRDYIAIEQFLFDKGKYNAKISNGYASLSPAVEIMLMNKNNSISAARKTEMLDSIASHDNRNDLNRYFYRHSINQQYQFNTSGGSAYNKHYFSIGYDKNLANTVINSSDRLTVHANNISSFLKDKGEFLTQIMLVSSGNRITGSNYMPLYPYENVAGPNGNALSVTDGALRLSYVDTAGAGKLLDWHYRPLDELRGDYNYYNSRLLAYKVNLGLNYKITPYISVGASYTYDRSITESNGYNSAESYYSRNLINSYTQIDRRDGTIIRPLPLGDILTANKEGYDANYGRIQLNYIREFNRKHALNIIAGYDVKDYQSQQSYSTLYGYNPKTATNQNSAINPLQNFPIYYDGSTSKIPLNIGNTGTVDRYISYFANSSYDYKKKYLISASIRRDESNLFGVRFNQKGVPLWSTGLAWILSNEDFYKLTDLPYLKIRATFGYSGNPDKTTSAYLTTKTVEGGNFWGQPVLQVNNPPNPSLRWEKVRNTNFGLDFSTKDKRLTGSLECWIKYGIDLIGISPIAPQTGVSLFKGNSANMRTKGIDLTLSSMNMNGSLKWITTFLFNYNTDKITNYKGTGQGTNDDIVTANYTNPLEGHSYYSIFSYKWMGLDHAGNPQSLLNGQVSKDYVNITSSTNSSELVNSGTSRPKYYGGCRNTFLYKQFELSFNITYKLGYYYRRASLSNLSIYQGHGALASFQQPDYELRWQNPGDELHTDVPGLIYPAKFSRDEVYAYSDILVEKADHVRLQDLQLNFSINKEKIKKFPVSNINLYLYAANLGIIWKASSRTIDPDYPDGTPSPFTTALGVKANF